MARKVPDWSSDNHDAAIPEKVQLRVVNRQRPAPGEHPICPECTMPMLGKVEIDHKTALIDGGAHAEPNLRALHVKCHKLKTAREALARTEARTIQKKTYGIKKPKGRPMPGTKASGLKKNFAGTVSRRF